MRLGRFRRRGEQHGGSVTTDPAEAVLGTATPDAPPVGPLKDHVRRGGRAGIAAAGVEQALSALTTVVLVRLLSPRDFGIVAVANVIVGFVSIVSAVGAGPAIVKRTTIDRAVTSTIFWASLAAAGAGTVAIIALAPVLARGASIPAAAPYAAVLAPTLLLGAWSAVPRALLQRKLELGRIFRIEIVVAIVYTALQITLAAAGAGAWAVVVAQLVKTAVLAVLLLAAARWLPSRRFDRRVFRAEAGFGAGVFLTTTLSWLTKNLDYWVVARIGGARLLGVYYIAFVLPTIVRQRLTWVASDVLFPAFARLADDERRTVDAYVVSLRLHAFVGFPTMTGLALVAGPLVDVLFGPEWLAAVAPMRLLAIAAAVEFTAQTALTVLLAAGRADRTARVQLVRLAVLAAALLPAARSERLDAVALAVVAATAASAAVAHVLVVRQTGVTFGAVAGALVPVAVPTLAMAGAAAATLTLAHGPVLDLVATTSAGAVTYVAVGLALFPASTRGMLREAGRFVRTGRPARG